MTRISKKDRLKNCPRKRKAPRPKTGSLKDNLPKGYKEKTNAVEASTHGAMFIAKVK